MTAKAELDIIFTPEELNALFTNSRKLSLDELDQVAGGTSDGEAIVCGVILGAVVGGVCLGGIFGPGAIIPGAVGGAVVGGTTLYVMNKAQKD